MDNPATKRTPLVTTNGTLSGVRDIKVIETTTDDLYDPPQG